MRDLTTVLSRGMKEKNKQIDGRGSKSKIQNEISQLRSNSIKLAPLLIC